MSLYPNTVPSKRLAASITSGATSFRVNNILGWNGSALTSADFGTVHYVVFRNAAGTLMEIMQIDPSTIASASITINLRGLDFDGNISEVAANKLSWLANETIVEFGSHPPQLFRQSYVDLFTAQTIAGIKTFSSLPKTTAGSPTDDNEFARKKYVDDSVAGGSGIPNRVVVAGTAGETVAAGNLVYLKTSDNRWWKADADLTATVENVQLGFAQGSGTAGNAITSGVLILGVDSNQTGLTANTKYYASNTAGAISSSAGTIEVTVGMSLSTTSILLIQDFDQQITEDIQDALVGTSGTPSTSNKFVTDADTAAAATASKIARRNSTGDVTVPATPTASTDAGSKSYIDAKSAKLIASSITSVTSSVADTNANTMITVAIPANTLSTNRVIRMKMYGQWINGANSQTLTVSVNYGSTAAFSITFTSLADGSKQANVVWEVLLYANGATNAQKGRGEFRANQVLQTYTVAGNPNVLHWQDITRTLTEDSTGALNLTVKTQLGGTTNAPTLTIDNYTVELLS